MKTPQVGPMTIEDFVSYMRKHMLWLEGFANAIDNKGLQQRINSVRATLNNFEVAVGVPLPEATE